MDRTVNRSIWGTLDHAIEFVCEHLFSNAVLKVFVSRGTGVALSVSMCLLFCLSLFSAYKEARFSLETFTIVFLFGQFVVAGLIMLRKLGRDSDD